jgi:homoserine dehydrogenase
MQGGVIQVGFLGFGNVGGGAVRALTSNGDAIARKVGARFEVRRVVVRDISKPRMVDLPAGVVTTDPSDVVDDPEIDIVCELIGGVDPARGFVKSAIENGKSIVTANKEMVAKAGHDLMVRAEEKGVDFLFEGSVGGGIPIVQPLKQALAGNKITEVMGIVNGTTNYILTKMALDGADFAEVLAEAQAKGYAEADPAADVEGWDARYKIAILSSIAFNTRVDISEVTAEGITGISKRDIEAVKVLGFTIKLLGIGTSDESGVRVRVHPALLRRDHPLASVNDVYNAVYVRGDSVGDVMFYGRGAGPGPTGSAVVGDIIEIGRNMLKGATGRLGCTCFMNKPNLPMSTLMSNYYVRLTAFDRSRVLASIASVFGDFDVSIETAEQRLSGNDEAELVILTHRTIEHNLRCALDILSKLPVVKRVDNWIRVEPG